MITREKEPPNLEMLFSALDSFVTPNERFYVRCHFPIPKINERDWRLKVEGKVARPFEVTMDDLRQMPTQTITVTLECAGNSTIAEPPRPAGKINFARSLPVAKAMDDVLLAHSMNGQPLTTAHGFPLRAIVPGWYGMAS